MGTAHQAVYQLLRRRGGKNSVPDAAKRVWNEFRGWRMTPLAAAGVLEFGWRLKAQDKRMADEMRKGVGADFRQLSNKMASEALEDGMDELNILTPLQWIRWWLEAAAPRLTKGKAHASPRATEKGAGGIPT